VDEGGWEYSFMFSRKFSWHGSKWWNSFVRRRAWIRKRIKKRLEDIPMDVHMLNTNYFTVRSASHSRHTRSPSTAGSHASKGSVSAVSSTAGDEPDELEIGDVEDVETLLMILRRSRIDREKIEAVQNYVEHGADDLVHLQEQMHQIMSLFIFQASRRILLAWLTQQYDETVEAQEKDKNSEPLRKRKEYLSAAIKHADEEVRKLAYWSDIKGMAEGGESHGAVDERKGWGEGWDGVDKSGPAHVNSEDLL
jgi:hypothetical protein